MKKKITAIFLCVALVAIAIVGASLAYFTDTDTATNTFTVGGVKINLIEQQRGEDGLVPFEQNKILMPIVGSAQGAKDEYDMPVAKNYVDKIITVQNTGASEAYVRVFVAVPANLQNGQTPNAPSEDILHFNWNKASSADGQWTDEIVVDGSTTIDGVVYRIYSRTYKTALKANEITASPAYIGFYLDKGVDIDSDGNYTVKFGNKPAEVINFDFSKGVSVPVFAQAVQADGFTDYADAFAKAGLPSNPWA